MTFAAFEKIKDMRTQVDVRDPANFDMHTKEDHAGYGVMQVVQNLIIDFERAGRMEGNWKDQWALCEAMAMFHLSGSAEPLNQYVHLSHLVVTLLLISNFVCGVDGPVHIPVLMTEKV
jgi:hypothetical protein